MEGLGWLGCMLSSRIPFNLPLPRANREKLLFSRNLCKFPSLVGNGIKFKSLTPTKRMPSLFTPLMTGYLYNYTHPIKFACIMLY